MLELYRSGGIWMHPIVLWSLVAGGAVAVHALRRDRDLTRLIIVAMVMALGLGILGVLIGMIEVYGAVESAPADQRERLMRIGLSIAFNPLALALFGVLLVGHFAVPVLWLTRGRRATTPS
jgi:hypothetical protein